MAWNKPSTENQQKKKPNAKMPSAKHGILAGVVIIVALGALCLYLFSNGEATSSSLQKKDRGLIKEVKPAAAPKPKEPAKANALQTHYPELNIPDDWDKPYPPQAYRADGSLKQHSRYVTVYTNRIDKSRRSLEERTFSNRAERDIAFALSRQPGDMVVGERKYNEKFIKSFLESLEHPVELNADDTDKQRTLKQWVQEAKKELKAAYDRGEDIAEIMNETRKQHRELGLYKQEIKQLVRKARKETEDRNGVALSAQDEHDLISAANKMLEERGCSPLALPETFVETVTHELKEHEKEIVEKEVEE